jgi:hypothetical protein
MPKNAASKVLLAPKQIRFSELVKKCGKPETVTLWTKPENNPPFIKAVRQNRVLTLVLKPHGNHPDFGEISFHQKPNALYLVFPRSLPKSVGARVIGIKYDLIEERASVSATKTARLANQVKPVKKAAPIILKEIPKEKPKPVPLKKFSVTVLRTASVEEKVTVPAFNIHDAEAGALQVVNKLKFKPRDIQDDIKAISEI